MSDLDRLLKQVEELKALAARQDDSWMSNMSNDQLLALGKRVRKVADGLSGLQGRLQGSTPKTPMKPMVPKRAAGGSLGNMVRRDTAASGGSQSVAPAPHSRTPNPFPMPQSGSDMSNPMQRRRVGGPSIPSEGRPATPQTGQGRKPGEAPPPGKYRGYRPPF